MAIFDTKTVRYIVPDSATDPEAAKYEFFLRWVAADGGVYCWLFEDFTQKNDIKGEIISTKSDNINKIINSAQKSYTLTAEDLNESERDAVATILTSKAVERVHLNGNIEHFAVLTGSDTKRQSDFAYNYEIEIVKKEDKTLI